MPELPEVEVAARNLSRWALGRRVRSVECFDPRTLDGARPSALRRLTGSRLSAVERIGKNLLLTFSAGKGVAAVGVWSHLGMTGKWLRRDAADPAPRFSRVRIDFVAGPTLHFVDMRLFGFFRVVPGARFNRVPALAALGPDPLRDGIDPARLEERLARIGIPIKVALLDQSLIPGVGNIQASEGLHRAGIDPRRPARSLERAELARLARALLASFQHTLASFASEGVVAAAASPRSSKAGRPRGGQAPADIVYVEESRSHNPFRVYERAGTRCSRCRKGLITRLAQAGRSTYFCPACQK